MKITIFTENFIGYRKHAIGGEKIFGGGEVLLNEYGRLLVDRGDDVTVVQMGTEEAAYTFSGMKIVQLRVPQLAKLSKVGLVRRWHWGGIWLDSRWSDSDWLHFHHHFLAFPHFSKKSSLQTVTGFSHGVDWDVDDVYRTASMRNLKERFSFYLLKQVSLRNAQVFDRFWCNDRYFANYITLNRPDLRRRLWHIPNFADTDVFHPKVVPSAELLQRANGRAVVLLPKMPSRDRGTDIALRAMKDARLRGVLLAIVGDSDATDLFKRMAGELGVCDRVWFAGHRDHYKELPSLYAAANCVIIPSPWREATALALLESLSCGRPTVCSNIGGMPEVAIDDWNALVRFADPSEFASAIHLLLEDHQLAQRLSLNARAWVSEHFALKQWKLKAEKFFTK